jgi:hypothetical protein
MDENNCDDFDISTGTCYIDLLTLTGMNRRVVFDGTMAAGNYNWLRLLVEAELNVIDSYIEFDDGSLCSLYIPSGAETGLKINSGFTVTTNGQSDYTLDFDVRTSIVAPPGQLAPALACQQNYFLKPSIRIVDTTQVGAIAGTVDMLVLQNNASCTLDGLGFYENVAVYVFENPTATAVGDDIDGGAQFPDPITSASVVWDNDPTVQAYTYEVGYLLAPENYQLALTCTADIDAIEVDDYDPAMPNASAFTFVDEQSVDVTVGGIADGSF